MTELVRGASAPLFDRLSSESPVGAGALLLLPEQIEASIARELSRLFNTRSRLMPSEYHLNTGTVIDYGIPDYSALSPRRGEDRALLEAALQTAVSLFEPRMRNVSVKVVPVPDRGHAATAAVSGDVVIGLKTQRVSFALDLNPTQDAAASA
jgi:type VI secretion system protein ImpF